MASQAHGYTSGSLCHITSSTSSHRGCISVTIRTAARHWKQPVARQLSAVRDHHRLQREPCRRPDSFELHEMWQVVRKHLAKHDVLAVAPARLKDSHRSMRTKSAHSETQMCVEMKWLLSHAPGQSR